MRSVIDASTTVASLLVESSDAGRGAMLGDAHAPGLIDVEVTHTLRGLLRAPRSISRPRSSLARS